jgi:hypothetical protein
MPLAAPSHSTTTCDLSSPIEAGPAEPVLPAPDDLLVALLAETRAAEAVYATALNLDHDDLGNAASDRLAAAITAMADTPAAGWRGIAAKAARLVDSLGSDPNLSAILDADKPLVRSLRVDLARMEPALG